MGAGIEPTAIMKLRAWRQAQLAQVKGREDALADQLRAAVPKSLKRWIREELCLIQHLLEYGSASRKYYQDEYYGLTYGYTNLDEFVRRFEELRVAWQGVVEINICQEGNYRFEVFFTAI